MLNDLAYRLALAILSSVTVLVVLYGYSQYKLTDKFDKTPEVVKLSTMTSINGFVVDVMRVKTSDITCIITIQVIPDSHAAGFTQMQCLH